MEKLSPKEFLDQLTTNNLKPSFSIKGVVKKSVSETELLFSRKGDMEHWESIPMSMIESVFVQNTFEKEHQTFVLAELHFKTPTTPEGIVLQKLMSHEGHGEIGCGKGHCHCHSHGSFHCHCGCGCSGGYGQGAFPSNQGICNMGHCSKGHCGM